MLSWSKSIGLVSPGKKHYGEVRRGLGEVVGDTCEKQSQSGLGIEGDIIAIG